MKNLIFLFVFLISSFSAIAQNSSAPIMAVWQIDATGLEIEPARMGDLARIELDKLNKFQILDKHDMLYLLEQNNFKNDRCFGRLCAIEVGKVLEVDRMLTGSAELIGDMLLFHLKLINVATGEVEKSHAAEFINNPDQVLSMLSITLRTMFGMPIDEELLYKLTKKNNYQSIVNTPKANRINLNGPRMGLVVFSGPLGDRYQAPRSEGGYDALPVMFQFGYQFEVNYLTEGNLQGLFEFIPLLTGLDQGILIPSFSFLNGFRSSKSGFEFAFGPTISFAKVSEGYYDQAGNWHLSKEWDRTHIDEENPYPIVKSLDNRGLVEAQAAFVFGIGKTFKSGRMNIPVNAFFIPGKNNAHRFGISVGFNAKR